jgi:FixJ family two-component response regulator
VTEDRPIAVIDDDESMRKSLEGLLRSLGHTVRVFDSADAFLACGGPAAGYGCIVSDIQMPGTSGIELQLRLKAAGDAPPLILMTAFANEITRTRATEAGATCFLAKPFDANRLIECIERALAAR